MNPKIKRIAIAVAIAVGLGLSTAAATTVSNPVSACCGPRIL